MENELFPGKKSTRIRSLVLRFVMFVAAGVTLACFMTDLLTPKRIVEGKPFAPTVSMVIESGSYHVKSVNIPANVKVDFGGDVEMTVDGDMAVSGTIAATCSRMRFTVGGNLDFSGAMNNQCNGDVENPPGIFMQIQGDSVGLGKVDSTAEIESSGDVTIIIGPEREAWEYDMHPDIRPAEKTAPVCSATSDTAGLTLFQGEPATVVFSASGVDPDGGPVRYYWSFGDGETSSEQNPAHAFRSAGVYQVQMVGTDDDGQSCQEVMTIVVFGEEGGIETPGVSVVLSDVVVEQNVPVEFRAEVYDPASGEIDYAWQMGDYSTSEEAPIYAFGQVGRYVVSLTVTNSVGVQATATASVYVFPSARGSARAYRAAEPRAAPPDCKAPVGVYPVFNPVTEGRNIRIDYWPILHERPIMIMDTAIITAKNGESFNPLTGKGAVYGENGGHGGNIIIRNWVSDTIVCGGASLIVGDGGDGQDAASISNGPSQSAYARGGNGGAPGDLVLAVQPWNKLIIQAGPTNNNVSIFPGDGGLGGEALAIGGDGADDCQVPGRGGEATAVGGRGGSVSYVLTFNGVFRGGGKIEIGLPGGNGGGGGRAAALGGKGGSARQANGLPCDILLGICADGASGGKAIARGGNGGSAFLFLKVNAINSATMKGGNGGNVRAEGGKGGDGGACCQQDTGPIGGDGGRAEQVPGWSGRSNVSGNGAAGASMTGVTLKICGQTVNTRGEGSGGYGGVGGNGARVGGRGGYGGKGKGKGVLDGGWGVPGGVCGGPLFTPTTGLGEKPIIVGLEFPIGHTIDLGLIDWTLDIPADGSKVVGKVWYSDPDGDMSYAYFKPADDDTVFDPFGFYLADLSEEDRGGDLYNGYFIFWITCPERGEHYFQFTLQDSAGNWSNWKTFVFKCR